MKQETKEAFFNSDTFCFTDQNIIDKLLDGLKDSPTGRYRYCMHTSVDSSVQEMVIAMSKSAKNRPHSHKAGASESFHIIKGELDVYFFDRDGKVVKKHSYGEIGSGKPFIFRLSDSVYHMPVPKSEVVVFHEVVTGPYTTDRDDYPDWCPEADDPAFEDFLTGVLAFEGE